MRRFALYSTLIKRTLATALLLALCAGRSQAAEGIALPPLNHDAHNILGIILVVSLIAVV
jgi:hypothetical protein